MRHFVRQYRIEIIAGILVIVGLLLIVDWPSIITALNRIIGPFIRRLTPVGLIGLALIVGALAIIAWRMRVRFLRSAYWRIAACPRCGSPILRVHRSRLDKVVSAILLPHARRYRCSNAACGWQGLRHSHRHEPQRPEAR